MTTKQKKAETKAEDLAGATERQVEVLRFQAIHRNVYGTWPGVRAIARGLGIRHPTAHAHLRRLVEVGLVKQSEDGTYRVPAGVLHELHRLRDGGLRALKQAWALASAGERRRFLEEVVAR